jgi:hypothetical protein
MIIARRSERSMLVFNTRKRDGVLCGLNAMSHLNIYGNRTLLESLSLFIDLVLLWCRLAAYPGLYHQLSCFGVIFRESFPN